MTSPGRSSSAASPLTRLVSGFTDATLTASEWTHEAHLAVGTWHVARLGRDAALEELQRLIPRLNLALGNVNDDHHGYHDTITRAYVTLQGDGAVGVVDLVAMQKSDAKPGNAATPGGVDPVDTIALPPGARPFWIEIDAAGKYAYVSDEAAYASNKGMIYVIDVDPSSPTFNTMVRAIQVDGAPKGLRQLALDADGSKLYVAAPNREGYGAPDPAFPNSHILVLNIDPADKPADGKPNTEKYWELIGSVETHQETYGVTASKQAGVITFTNRYSDVQGFGVLRVTNAEPTAFAAETSTLGLHLGSAQDTFDVNNGISIAILPANAFKAVLGEHPAYAFVGAYNRFQQGIASSDPNEFPSTLLAASGPSGSNIGIIRDPFGAAELVGATTSIPIGVIDNLAFASGYNYLFAGFRGTGSVMVYNLVNLIGQVEQTYNDPATQSRLSRFPVDRLYFDQLLPMQEDLQLFNTAKIGRAHV